MIFNNVNNIRVLHWKEQGTYEIIVPVIDETVRSEELLPEATVYVPLYDVTDDKAPVETEPPESKFIVKPDEDIGSLKFKVMLIEADRP